MAKGPIFWNNATGKLGNLVLSVRKGQQITRQYQPNVANPRTFAQVAQRVRFSNAGKFYKRAITNFFIQAYEGSEKISPWNAFMKYNANKACFVTREQYLTNEYPSVGPYILSVGSLGVLNVEVNGDTAGGGGVGLICPNLSSTDNTIGKVSAKILANNPQLLNGDVITFISIISLATGVESTPSTAPAWRMIQFTLDTANTSNLPNGLSVGTNGDDLFELTMPIPSYDDDYLVGGAVIVARKTTTGVKATNSALVLNFGARAFYNSANSGAYETQSLLSWGAVASDAVIV